MSAGAETGAGLISGSEVFLAGSGVIHEGSMVGLDAGVGAGFSKGKLVLDGLLLGIFASNDGSSIFGAGFGSGVTLKLFGLTIGSISGLMTGFITGLLKDSLSGSILPPFISSER